MVFAEYARVIKRHFKHKISDADLCEVLFDAVIEPLDLRNRNGEIWTVDKAEVSRIMNRKKNIPKALYNHICDKKISPAHKEKFRDMASPQSASLFLSEVFVHALR